jgi:hypothetical protein
MTKGGRDQSIIKLCFLPLHSLNRFWPKTSVNRSTNNLTHTVFFVQAQKENLMAFIKYEESFGPTNVFRCTPEGGDGVRSAGQKKWGWGKEAMAFLKYEELFGPTNVFRCTPEGGDGARSAGQKKWGWGKEAMASVGLRRSAVEL